MKRSTKIILICGLAVLVLGASSVAMLGLFFWELAEGTRLSSLGYEKMMQKDYDGAITNLTEASKKIVLGQNRFWLYVNRGAAEIQKKRYDEAIKDFTEAIKIDPSQADPYERRGQAYETKKERESALADYDRAIELDPNRGLSHLQRGKIHFDRGEIDKALADYNEVVRIWPNYGHGFLMRGRCYLKQGDLDHALASLDAAVRLEPRSPVPHEERAQVYRRRGEAERAFFDTAEAQYLIPRPRLRKNSSPSPTPGQLGAVGTFYAAPLPSLQQKDPAIVRAQYRNLIKDATKAFENRDDDRAIDLFNKALALEIPTGEASRVTMARGRCYWRKGDHAKALADYEEAIKLDPRNSVAYLDRAGALDDKGNIEGALQDCAESIRLYPREYFAFCDRGLSLFHQDNLDDALVDLDKSIEIDAANPQAYAVRALVRIEKNEPAKAISDCTTAMQYHPEVAGLYSLRARAYIRLGQFDLAEKDIKTLATLKDDDDPELVADAVAWFRATCPNAQMRDGRTALSEARKAFELEHWRSWESLDTLAAAEAEVGDFRQAVAHQEEALRLSVPPVRLRQVQERLALYRQHKPFRQPTAN